MPRTSGVQAVTAIGIDMGKNVLHMIGLDSHGAAVLDVIFRSIMIVFPSRKIVLLRDA